MVDVFDGKKLAGELENQLKIKVEKFKRKTSITPKLVDIIIGNDPASVAYAKMKKKAAERVGMEMEILNFSESMALEKIILEIRKLNANKLVHGILVQLPIPKKISNFQFSILNSIDPKKDTDCLTPGNLGLVLMGEQRVLPATVSAILRTVQSAKCVVKMYVLLAVVISSVSPW